MNLVMQPELVEHFRDRVSMPKRSLLFDYRLYVDYCCMLWAREHVFASDLPDWHTHFRLDSSPQFGRNYLVGELDRICLKRVSPTKVDDVFSCVEISTRLCPLQILGKQATSTAFKARSCLRMLSLECDVGLAREKCRSLLTDMGVESGLWVLPDLGGEGGRCFPESMPLADSDHMLHHTMLDAEDGFSRDNHLWISFDHQIQAISKCFSKQDHCDRYCQKNIWENGHVPEHSRRGLASMFSRKCPTYIKTRWHFAFDVLHWVAGRKQLIEYLEPASMQSVVGTGHSDITAAEAKAFQDLGNADQRARFWACFWCYYTLLEWGFRVQTWMHRCPCHNDLDDTACSFRGRRMIEFVCGQRAVFLAELKSLMLDARPRVVESLRALQNLDSDSVVMLRKSFESAKRVMYIRYEQSTAFFCQYPWCVPKLLEFILPASRCKHDEVVLNSKKFAQQLLKSWNDGAFSRKTFGDNFFEGVLGNALSQWAASTDNPDAVMQEYLFKEVLAYGMSLLCMQRLESRHHLVGMKMSPARANSAAAVSAMLRRRLNPDCNEPSFQMKFGTYLQQFDLLVPEQWTTMRELHSLISGHHLALMFKDMTAEEQLIQSNAVRRTSGMTCVDYQNHLAAALTEGAYYAVPVSSSKEETVYHLLQLVTLKPASKKYMERVVTWFKDDWYERVGVYSFGTTSVPAIVDLECDASDGSQSSTSVRHLPPTFSVNVAAGTMEAVPVEMFFACGFENLLPIFLRGAQMCVFAGCNRISERSH